MTTYNLTVMVAYLNGRDAPNGNLNFPAGASFSTGFRLNDVLVSDFRQLDANGITYWYRITKCTRNGVDVTLPATVFASDGGSYKYLRVDSIVTDPPPSVDYPLELWVSLTENGEKKRYIIFN